MHWINVLIRTINVEELNLELIKLYRPKDGHHFGGCIVRDIIGGWGIDYMHFSDANPTVRHKRVRFQDKEKNNSTYTLQELVKKLSEKRRQGYKFADEVLL